MTLDSSKLKRTLVMAMLIATAGLAALYTFQQKVRIPVFDEPSKAKFVDLNSGVVKAADPTHGFIESTVTGPVRVEFEFKNCLKANVVRLFVGTHGTDSTQRLPAHWKISTRVPNEDWQPSGFEYTAPNYQNGNWYSFPLRNASCFSSLAFDIDSITGSNVLRIYKIQVYQLPLPFTFSKAVDALNSSISQLFESISRMLKPIPFDPAMLTALLSLFSLEAGIRGWNRSILYRLLFNRSASTNRDIVCALLNITGWLALATGIYSLGGGYITEALKSNITEWMKPHAVSIDTGSILVDIFLYLLIITFFDYWLHRLIHTYRFWPLHRFHHSATEFNGITVFRNHPALFAFEPIIKLWPLAFIPIAPQIIPYWPIAGFLFWLHQVVTHSDVNWRFGWLGSWLFVSPALHKIHHSSNPDHYNKNYGNLFIVWDRIFGTYLQLPPQKIILGTSQKDDYMNKKWIFEEWALDMINFVRLLFRLKPLADNVNILTVIRRG